MRGSRWNQSGNADQGRTRRLDNLALVPASLLSRKTTYQRVANQLPDGAVLVVLPNDDSPERRTLQETAARLRAKGHPVATMTVAEVLQPTRRPGAPQTQLTPLPEAPGAGLPEIPAAPEPLPEPAAAAPQGGDTIPPFRAELRLVRIDDSDTPARFEVLQWQPTLWGQAALVRYRGTLGQPVRRDIALEAGVPDADAALARLVRRRLRAGYAIADWL